MAVRQWFADLGDGGWSCLIAGAFVNFMLVTGLALAVIEGVAGIPIVLGVFALAVSALFVYIANGCVKDNRMEVIIKENREWREERKAKELEVYRDWKRNA